MIIFYPCPCKEDAVNKDVLPVDPEGDLIKKALPTDWAFMEKSAEVLADNPDTWKQYPTTKEGAMGIIDMEFRELKRAANSDALSCELVHVASACLYMWRMLNATE